jgi:hypothetical protein
MYKESEHLAAIQIVNYDQLFRDDPDAYVIECGADTILMKDQMTQHKLLFFQDGSKDLTNISSCDCGHLTGNYMAGCECPICHTICKTNFAEELKFRAWLEIPDFLPPVLHPAIYLVLDNWLGSFSKSSGRIMDILLNTELPLPEEYQGILGQGFWFFYNNFDNIINFFATQYKKLTTPEYRRKTVYVLQFLEKYKDRRFLRHMPSLNSSLHLSTQSGSITYSDNVVKYIIQAKIELHQLIYVHFNATCADNYVDKRMYTMYHAFLEYSTAILNEKLLKKPGFIRKHLLGARLYCSARAVIVPLFDIHDYDEIHIPWLMAVQVLKLEIINVLMNRMHKTEPEALAIHRRALAMFDPLVYDIMNTLVKECPFKGLPVLMGRNPSLRLGAIFLLYATKIKPEYEDATVGISSLISSAPNFDFDGDAMHLLFVKEMGEVPKYEHIHPSNTMVASSDAMISSDVQITDQAALAINRWLLADMILDQTKQGENKNAS